MLVVYWRRSDFFCNSSRHLMFSGPTSTSSMRSNGLSLPKSQSRRWDLPVPRWSTSTMSRSRRTRPNGPAEEVYKSTADVPGPPAMRNSGSGALFRLMAGTRATNSSILRPCGAPGSSAISKLPHSAGKASIRAGCSSRQGCNVSLPPADCAASGSPKRSPANTPSRIMRRAGYMVTGCARNSIPVVLGRSPAAQAIHSGTTGSVSGGLIAILRVVFLAMDAARLLVGLVMQLGALAAGHHTIGLGAYLDSIQVGLARDEPAGLGPGEFTARHTVVDACSLVLLAGIHARRAGLYRSGGNHRQGCNQDRLVHDFLPFLRRGRKFGRLSLTTARRRWR